MKISRLPFVQLFLLLISIFSLALACGNNKKPDNGNGSPDNPESPNKELTLINQILDNIEISSKEHARDNIFEINEINSLRHLRFTETGFKKELEIDQSELQEGIRDIFFNHIDLIANDLHNLRSLNKKLDLEVSLKENENNRYDSNSGKWHLNFQVLGFRAHKYLILEIEAKVVVMNDEYEVIAEKTINFDKGKSSFFHDHRIVIEFWSQVEKSFFYINTFKSNNEVNDNSYDLGKLTERQSGRTSIKTLIGKLWEKEEESDFFKHISRGMDKYEISYLLDCLKEGFEENDSQKIIWISSNFLYKKKNNKWKELEDKDMVGTDENGEIFGVRARLYDGISSVWQIIFELKLKYKVENNNGILLIS